VAAVPSGLSLTPLRIIKKRKCSSLVRDQVSHTNKTTGIIFSSNPFHVFKVYRFNYTADINVGLSLFPDFDSCCRFLLGSVSIAAVEFGILNDT
jgi:hypothetical protein